jgi:hypothetical protein
MCPLITFIVFAALLAACVPNLNSGINRPRLAQQRVDSNNDQTVQLVVIPSSAYVPIIAHRLSAQNILIRPAIGTHQGFAQTLEEPGDLATEAICQRFF